MGFGKSRYLVCNVQRDGPAVDDSPVSVILDERTLAQD
jgi:hypothetical protein